LRSEICGATLVKYSTCLYLPSTAQPVKGPAGGEEEKGKGGGVAWTDAGTLDLPLSGTSRVRAPNWDMGGPTLYRTIIT
jgi:hypothetical protein